MDNHQQDTGSQHHELFLQEIEGIDEYWGPTFRYVHLTTVLKKGWVTLNQIPR